MKNSKELQHVGDEPLPFSGLRAKQKGYAEMIHCKNCHWFDSIYIPFGITIKDYLKDKACERCKCIGVLY